MAPLAQLHATLYFSCSCLLWPSSNPQGQDSGSHVSSVGVCLGPMCSVLCLLGFIVLKEQKEYSAWHQTYQEHKALGPTPSHLMEER